MKTNNSAENELFYKLRDQLNMLDPVNFAEKHLTLEGEPFRLTNNGYKPFADIYRYIGIKALEPNAKPVIMVKGRQVGGTIMACVLEMYFMGSGLFGTENKPPIRVIHAFPLLEHAAAYSKTKLNQMIAASVRVDDPNDKKGVKIKSYMQNLLDPTSPTNDSLTFKQFVGGNHLWIESTGLDADRLMGRTADVLFFDECFPAKQKITTDCGKKTIGKLYNDYINNKQLPLIESYNERIKEFELKKITNIWKKGKRELLELNISGRKIQCTDNHLFLTENGWKEASNIEIGELIKSSIDSDRHVRSLNEDQKQIVLGSFLGDGHVQKIDKSRYRLSIIHGYKQKEYCSWKANIFKESIIIVEKNGYSQLPAVRFSTKSFGLNKELPKTKNICPQWVLDEIDARGIAIWFMDDGSKNRVLNNLGGSATISTCSFDEDSQIRIVKKFHDLGIKCHYAKYNNYYSIYFNTDDYKKLCDLIRPYIHENMLYKINYQENKYIWNNEYENYGWLVLNNKNKTNISKEVYDIEIEDNHNFILAPIHGKKVGGPIVHNCQKTTGLAMGNALKILTSSKYGKPGKGVQIYFGTPRKKGSDFHKMWQTSSQQYYYLGCGKCEKHFPLYTPGSDDWEKIWIYGYIVKCPHCGFEQDKREAAERGKWVALKDHRDDDCKMIGFHINQLYFPTFKREDIDNEKPGKHPINTERIYQTEVLGEFFQGDSSPITPEEIADLCADRDRKFSARINPGDKPIVVVGFDYGQRSDLEQLADSEKSKISGQSYSTAVVLSAQSAGLLSIEFCTKFKRNDPASKKGIIDQIMRQYSIQLAVGDIGYSGDLSSDLHNIYGDRYLVSRAHSKVNNYIKFRQDTFPKEIIFERDYYIRELYELMKKGQIRFPFKDYEKCAWLIDHCTSMEIKPSISRSGSDPVVHYVKGSTPNDGFMALLNAYIAYKYLITKGFSTNNPFVQQQNVGDQNKPLALTGIISRKF